MKIFLLTTSPEEVRWAESNGLIDAVVTTTALLGRTPRVEPLELLAELVQSTRLPVCASVGAVSAHDHYPTGPELAKRAEAERLPANANDAEKYARKPDKQTGAIAGVKLVAVRTATITDMTAFSRYVWTTHRADLAEWLTGYARQLCKSGIANLPGVTIVETKEVR